MNEILVQTLVSILLALPTFMVAVANTWTSYTLLILESDASPVGKITQNDANLISSMVMLGSLPSVVFVGYANDKIGRKRTELLSGLSYALAWSIITTAKTVTQLLIGRFLIGVAAGVHFVTGVVYIGEITQPAIRGTLLSVMSLMYNVGSLLSYLEGWFCSYDVTNYLNLSVAVGFILMLLCIKETPVYLLRMGREKEAINSLKFYRGKSTVTQEILDEIVYMRKQLSNNDTTDIEISELDEKEKLNQEEIGTFSKNIIEQQSVWSTLRTSKSALRALIILVINMDLAVCMGMIAVQAYAGQFFMQAAPSLSPHLCSVLLAVVVTITSGVSVVLVDLVPRRVLMMSTCLLSAGCMACLWSMLRWSWAPEWGIPLVMVFYCIFYHLGAVNIPFVQMAECLPPQIISFGTGVVMFSMFMANFAVLFTFKPAVTVLGLDGTFLVFAIIGLIAVAVVFVLMRETRKVPFDEVQETFEQGFFYRRHKCS